MEDLGKLYKLLQRYYQKYSELYDFKIADAKDIDKIVEFIDTHWKKNHALVLSRELMEYQHYDKKNNRYNFILAVEKKSGDIHALQGFIPSSQYDNEIKNSVYWGAIWKNREDINIPGLGMILHWFGFEKVPYNTFVAVGISDSAYPIYNRLPCKTGYCIQWYIINPVKETFKLIANYENVPRCSTKAPVCSDAFAECSIEDYMTISGKVLETIPVYKSKTYYINRFFRHPIYKYHAAKIMSPENECKAVFFWRMCEHDGAKCIRVADYFGSFNALCGQRANFQKLLTDYDAEFIDFINIGIDKKYFESAGFIDRSTTNLILANYFEPFMLENVDNSLRYAWYSKDNIEPLFFKGDADQDRPNLIKV